MVATALDSAAWFLVGLAVGWALPLGMVFLVLWWMRRVDRAVRDRSRLGGP